MTLLSLFMTSTGIFCFVPISQRLAESGIIPASRCRRSWSLRSVLASTSYARKEYEIQSPPVSVKVVGSRGQGVKIPIYPMDHAFAADQEPVMGEWNVSPPACSPTTSLLHFTSPGTFYGRESASFISDTSSTLCDSCHTLLRREIPEDHIPSVIRALALLEAQDRPSDVGFSECEIVALTDAFSMLRL